MGKVQVHVMAFLLMLGPVLFMFDKSHADPLQILHQNLPNRIMGWRVEAEDRFFDSVTIFDYINGAGEVYRSYNMKNAFHAALRPQTVPLLYWIFLIWVLLRRLSVSSLMTRRVNLSMWGRMRSPGPAC